MFGKRAPCQYDPMVGMKLSSKRGITCWLEEVRFLLASYAKAKDIPKEEGHLEYQIKSG